MSSVAPGALADASPAPGPVGLIEAKLQPPHSGSVAVSRTRLLRLLRSARGRPLVSLVAPPGYGKTSVLAQWAARDDRPVAWLTIDELDNDPAVFLTYLATALYRQGPLEPTIFSAISSRAVPDRAIVGRLLSAMSGPLGPVLVVIDDAHRLTDQACLDTLSEFITYLPGDAQVATAGREAAGLPLARWRAQGLMLEVGPGELAMDQQEVAALVRQLGVELPSGAIEHLTAHTEGWPALVGLVARAARDPERRDVLTSPHAEPSTAEYLRSEVLAQRTVDEVTFLTRTSIPGQLSGPLCDALLGQTGSAALLAGLARSTLLIDDYDGWYRYHNLLRDFLRSELEGREPGQVAQLHRRAARWYGSVGDFDLAVSHAFHVGDPDLAATTVGKAMLHYHWSGRRTTMRSWLRHFDDEALVRRPWLAVIAAWEEVAAGDVGATERLADIAERGSFAGRPPDGTASFESGRAMLRAAMGRAGVQDMLANATYAVEVERVGSRWRDFALWVLGITRQVQGDLAGAEAALADATDAARAGGNDGLAYCILGHRALTALDRQDRDAALALWAEAEATGAAGRLDGYLSGAFARVAAIRLAIGRGDVRSARQELSRATVLRPLLTAAAPGISVLALFGLARAHLAVDDASGARTVLRQAEDVLRQRPGLGTLPGQVAAMRTTIASLPLELAGASTLTAAELRVLAMLPYYLSFKEIGQRLGVKATTVKTHALSIYGKLGASSRSEAVDLAVEAELLERFPVLAPISTITEDASDDAG